MSTIVGTLNYAKKVLDMKKSGTATYIKNIVLVGESSVPADVQQQAEATGITVHTFESVIEVGSKQSCPRIAATKDDIHVISYTSGTTGDPKGVKLSHENLLSNAKATGRRTVCVAGDPIISYLPYTHSFEQGLFTYAVFQGLKIGFYQGNPLKLMEDCALLKPVLFPSVPRLYNKIYGSLKLKFNEVTGCKRWLLDRGLRAKEANLAADGTVTHGCYDMLLFGKASQMLGGRVRQMVTGSAPIDKQVVDFLKIVFSCPIQEGYGLTESSAAGSIMSADDMVTGHVGGPVEVVKFKLQSIPAMEYEVTDKPYPRGELLLKGLPIFKGYYKNEEKTNEAFDEQGWFKTGDVVQVYENGSLKIIDRSKNIFKLSQGEYIAPEKIEGIFGLSPYIAQCLVYGNSFKNSCVAIVVPDEPVIKKWANENGVTGEFADLIKNKELIKAINADMLKLATENKLSSLEKPKKMHLSAELFSVENDCLTPTFKLKRHQAAKYYQKQIDEMYVVVEEMEAARDAANAKK